MTNEPSRQQPSNSSLKELAGAIHQMQQQSPRSELSLDDRKNLMKSLQGTSGKIELDFWYGDPYSERLESQLNEILQVSGWAVTINQVISPDEPKGVWISTASRQNHAAATLQNSLKAIGIAARCKLDTALHGDDLKMEIGKL